MIGQTAVTVIETYQVSFMCPNLFICNSGGLL